MRRPVDSRRWQIRPIIITGLSCVLVVLLAGAGLGVYVSSLVPELFRLNKVCQEEGYYMAEFEFKMLGFVYQLDHGQYMEALKGIRRLRDELRVRKGLVKVPRFTDPGEELEFYLGLQNPRTGAFMDDSFPYCTYDAPTQNVVLHLESLAKAAGRPLKLRYRLSYLDAIQSPAKLEAYLRDVSLVGPAGAMAPQTSFVFARELLDHAGPDGTFERNQLYAFSHEWKDALLAWFSDFQDPETGFWGPKSRRSGKLLKLDLNNTASIVKAFVDRDGNDIHPRFPLRHRAQMFSTALKVMAAPVPADQDLAEWHEWALKVGKGSNLMTRYLWRDAPAEQRATAARLIADSVRIRFERYYIPEKGAFSYYPGAREATLDGTSGGVGMYVDLGAYSADRQRRLWGGREQTCTKLGERSTPLLTADELAPIVGLERVNSVRYYEGIPDGNDPAHEVAGIFYPRPTAVVDAVELIPRVRKWLNATPQSMGNWVSRAELSDRLEQSRLEEVPVARGEIPLEAMRLILQEREALTLVGFDVLQVPRVMLILRRYEPTSRRE